MYRPFLTNPRANLLKTSKYFIPTLYFHTKTLIPESETGIQISHPWPEWVELMERLNKKGYLQEYPSYFGEMGLKDSNRIRTACLNFARDRFDLIRYFSRKDIQVIVESGCPSIDRKVVNSGKRLRAHVGIDEGDVCSSCALRGNCERAYVKAREDEGGRTVDVMRILLSYGLGETIGSVENMPCLNKTVKDSVRRLLKETMDSSNKELDSEFLSSSSHWNSSIPERSTPERIGSMSVPMKQGDWICPKCSFLNFAKNIKCLRCNSLCQERLKKLGEDQDHLPLKKGDWLCDKCNFLNFAKNSRCLQCKEKPPKRQLNPGEWECDSCNYINFRRNTVCLKCDYKRPKASRVSDCHSESHHEDAGFHQTRSAMFVRDYANGQILERPTRNRGANVWNFVEDESSNHSGSNSSNQISGFVDFPIIGGKSHLSDNAEKQERWKVEMADKSRHSDRAMENVGYTKSTTLDRMSKSLEAADDEEMADWFGHGKVQKEKLVHDHDGMQK